MARPGAVWSDKVRQGSPLRFGKIRRATVRNRLGSVRIYFEARACVWSGKAR
jgi:hypothetical protein